MARTRSGIALLALCAVLLIILCGGVFASRASDRPTVKDAEEFVAKAEQRLLELWIKQQRAQWVNNNFITDDTETMAADALAGMTAATMELAKEATRFDKLKLPPDAARKLMLLKLSLTLPAPSSPAPQQEMTQIAASLESDYGKGKFAGPGGIVYDLNDLSRIMATSRNPDSLLMAWKGWRTISPPMKARYTRLVELANAGARELGFADCGALWRSNYDMPPDEFSAEVERLWQQVRPLYEALHAYVRAQLVKTYGAAVVQPDGLLPAHLLGNMWSQSWENIYPLVAPPGGVETVDLTAILREKKFDALEMVRTGERFFVSLGFEPLPVTFWDRSLFTKPRDRDVVCHASAWDIDFRDDLRIKMCIEPTAEDFTTVHHELGHNFYQRAYMQQPALYRNGANDGFHEAIGDMIALSVTPEYLNRIGLLDKVPGTEGDLGLLMQKALEKVAFLPFGLLIDQWRWKVFSGEIPPSQYNAGWWKLVEKYQGVKAPVARSEADFDPGAKYHIPASTPYTRYFLATILQFQFHRALAREAGWKGPLHRFTVYGNAEAGEKFRAMLAMGASRPWPEALEVLTGEKKMDATAMLEYFAPLQHWLEEQNKGQQCGW